MYEYYKRKIVYRKGYKRFPYNTDLLYEKLTKLEENNNFIAKYCKLEKQLKAEERY